MSQGISPSGLCVKQVSMVKWCGDGMCHHVPDATGKSSSASLAKFSSSWENLVSFGQFAGSSIAIVRYDKAV